MANGNDPAEDARVASLRSDATVQDIERRIHTASPAQIEQWIDQNVTTLAQARAVLKAIVKYLATRT